MLQRRHGWASETAEEGQDWVQQSSASQQDASVLPTTQETLHTYVQENTPLTQCLYYNIIIILP